MADNFDKNEVNTEKTRAKAYTQGNLAAPNQKSEEIIREYCRILQNLLN